MDKEKNLGLDGFTFTIAFSQECWDIIKEVMLKVFSKFCNSEVIDKSTNVTFVALVSKRTQTSKVSDFRPFSLITSLYKDIDKVLSHCI